MADSSLLRAASFRALTSILCAATALLAVGCDGDDKKPPAAAPSVPPVASAGPAASTPPKPSFPPMKPGTKKLANGKVLGEQSKDDLKKALEDAGWEVFSAATSRSSPHVVITTIGAKRGDDARASVHLYRYEDPEWRASRFKALKKEEGRGIFEDGDFLLQVGARKDNAPDEAGNKDLLKAIVGE